MSENRRYSRWGKKSKNFYRSRDIYALNKTLDLDKVIEFVNGCWRGNGFSINPLRKEIDLESTFVGVVLTKLMKISSLSLDNISGKLSKRDDIWRIAFGKRKLIAGPQNLYRFSLLMKMINKLDEKLKKIINAAIFTCYDANKQSFQDKIKGTNRLRHCYEGIVGLETCDYSNLQILNISFSEYQKENGEYRDRLKIKPDIQSIYNFLAIKSILNSITVDDRTKIAELIKSKNKKDGFRSSSNHHPNTWDNYCAILSLRMLNESTEKFAPQIEKYISGCQADNGGFRSGVHGEHTTILLTYAAMATLVELPNYENRFIQVNPLNGVIIE